MQHDELVKQLRTAISAIRNGLEQDSLLYIEHFSRNYTTENYLFETIRAHWRGSLVINDVTPCDCLQLLLRIPQLWFIAASECIECIQLDIINGRSAIYCISELRHFIGKFIRTSSSENEELSTQLGRLIELVVGPVIDTEKGLVTSHSFSNCLDLLPVLISSLHILNEEDIAYEMLDMIFSVKWECSRLVPLANILCEIYPYLNKQHLVELKTELLGSVKELSGHSDDYAGVIRAALGLFEQSHDMQWVHVLRVVYRSVPNSYIATVEALFEQICQESMQLTQMLLCAMEDCTILIGKTVVQNTYKKRSVLSLTSGSMYLYDDFPVVSYYDIRLVLVLTRSIETFNRLYSTTQNNNNNSSSSSSSITNINHHNEIPWPATTLSGLIGTPLQEEENTIQNSTIFDSQLSARCIFILLLTCTLLEIIEQIRFGEYKTGNMNLSFQNILKYTILQENDEENNTRNKERMYDSCAWINNERAKEIIKTSIILSRYNNITTICILQLHTWLQDHSLLKISIKTNSFFLLPLALEDMVLAAYRYRENMRGPIVSFLLNGLLTCASIVQTTTTSGSSSASGVSSSGMQNRLNNSNSTIGNSSGSNTNNNIRPTINAETLLSSEKKIPEELSAVATLLQKCFHKICTLQVYINTSILTHIQHKFPLLTSTICVQDVIQQFLVSLLLLCRHPENNVFSLVHNYLQKTIQNNNNIIQCSASYLLVSLLYSVPISQQEEIVRTVCFGFSRTAICCREVYCRLLQYLLPVANSSMEQSTTNTMRYTYTNNNNSNNIDDSNSRDSADSSVTASNSNMQRLQPIKLQERTLIYLRDSLQRKLSEQFHSSSDTAACGAGSGATITHRSTAGMASLSYAVVDEEEGCVFNPHFSLKPITSGTVILEDIQHSLLLLWVLDLKINSKQALHDMSLLIQWIVLPEGEQLNNEESYETMSVVYIHSILSYSKSGFTARKGDQQLPSSGDYLLTHCAYMYLALHSICKCLLYTLYILNTEDTQQDDSSSVDSTECDLTEESLFQALCEIMAVCDVTVTMISELSQQELTTYEQIQQFYHTKLLLTAATATAIATTSTSTTTTAVAAGRHPPSPSLLSVCAGDSCHVPMSVLLQLVEFIQALPTGNPNPSSSSGTVQAAENDNSNSTISLYPTSIKMGIFTHAVYLINTTITACSSANNFRYHEYLLTNINNINSDDTSGNVQNNLISNLLSSYKTMCSVNTEEAFIANEESLYRSFTKRQRRLQRGSSDRVKRSKRKCYYSQSRRRPGNGDRNVLQEDSEGEIQSVVSSSSGGSSDSDGSSGNNSEEEQEEVATIATGSASISGSKSRFLRGFQLHSTSSTTADNTRAMHPDSASTAVHYHSSSLYPSSSSNAVRIETLTNASTGASHLMFHQYALLHLHSHYIHAFSRYDIHIIQNHSTNKRHTKQQDSCLSNVSYLSKSNLYGQIRSMIFNTRSEVLSAIEASLHPSRLFSSELELEELYSMGEQVATELSEALQRGVMIRTFNAYIRVLNTIHQLLTSGNPEDDISTAKRLIISGLLWQSLSVFRTPHAHIISSVIQTALKYSDRVTGIRRCAAVLHAVGRQLFAQTTEKNSMSTNGDDADTSDNGHTMPSSSVLTLSTTDILIENEKENNINSNMKHPILVITKEVSDLSCKEILRCVYNSMGLFVKNPDVYSEGRYISQEKGEGLSGAGGFECGCEVSGLFVTTLFELFQCTNAPTSSNSSSTSISTSMPFQQSQEQGKELLLLIDNYTTERIIQVLDIVQKLLAVIIKDCNHLMKSAEYIRKLATFVETVRQNDSRSNKFLGRNKKYKQQSIASNSNSGCSSRGSYHNNSSFSNSSSASSSDGEYNSMHSELSEEEEAALLKQLELPYQRLCRLYTTTISSSSTQYTMLFSMLATMPFHVYIQFKKWLVGKIHSCPLNPKGEQLVLVRRVRAVLGEWDKLQAGLSRLLEVVNRRPRQALQCDVDNSDLSADLYNLVQSTYNLPSMSTLELVRTTGQTLLDCLQSADVPSDSECSRSSSNHSENNNNGVQKAYKDKTKKVVSISAIAAHKIAMSGKNSSTRNHVQVKKSRNTGVNLLMQLDGHTGDDTYADLEDFLV